MAHRPQKKWGQNFLRNRGAVEQIVAALEAPPGSLVLEIGPGKGALTEILAAMPLEIQAWEIDPVLAEALTAKFAGTSVEIVETDATEAELPDRPFRAVGNLPYNVATPIVRRVIASPNWRRAVFMFQKEVGDKLTAAPGDPDYGFLTLVVGLRAEVKRLIQLSPGIVLSPAEGAQHRGPPRSDRAEAALLDRRGGGPRFRLVPDEAQDAAQQPDRLPGDDSG
jgi:16S rRNA (adenine1518-N6/adenine1519-N6)-dimethyltransferase